MKILFVTSYPLEYNTSANIRNIGLIEGLTVCGHEVSTYSIFPTDINLFSGNLIVNLFTHRYWVEEQKPAKISSKKRQKYIGKIRVKIAGLIGRFTVYDLRRRYVPKINASNINETFDLLISSSDPKSSHLFAEKLLSQRPDIAKYWIQYWGDPFSNDISSKHVFTKKLVRREEKRLLKLADKVVYVSPFTLEYIIGQYPEFSEKAEFYPIPYKYSDSPKIQDKFDKRNVVVGYMGDYWTKNRNIIPLYNALVKTNIPSFIIGNSDLVLKQTENVIVKPRLSGDEYRNATKSINVIACVCNSMGTQIPGKVYHYVNSRNPIMIIVDGDNSDRLKAYFQSFKRFNICDNNEDSIISCLNEIVTSEAEYNVPESLDPQKIAENIISIKYQK